jgi:hypothetical protein
MASEKRDYAHLLEAVDLEVEVRSLMEGQHKSMLKRLRSGDYDAGIEARLGAGAWTDPVDGADTLRPDATDPAAAPAAAAPAARTAPVGEDESPKERLRRAFGDGVVSNKPLDEVVLDFLVENARKRKRPSK